MKLYKGCVLFLNKKRKEKKNRLKQARRDRELHQLELEQQEEKEREKTLNPKKWATTTFAQIDLEHFSNLLEIILEIPTDIGTFQVCLLHPENASNHLYEETNPYWLYKDGYLYDKFVEIFDIFYYLDYDICVPFDLVQWDDDDWDFLIEKETNVFKYLR